MDAAALRGQLAELLDGAGAHMPFEEAVVDFPDGALNARAPNVDYTPWHLVEHLRLTQADIVDYVTNPAYVEPHWPAAYWPQRDAMATHAGFDSSIRDFIADKAALRAMVMDPARDLFAVIPWDARPHAPARGPHRRRPQRLPCRRVRDPAADHGDVAGRPSLGALKSRGAHGLAGWAGGSPVNGN
jgi:hypothetical protein